MKIMKKEIKLNNIPSFLSKTVLLVSLSTLIMTPVKAKEEEGHLVSVDVVKREQVSPSIWLPGNVISRRNAPISAEQTGQLLWLEEVGMDVEKGDVIARIDARHLTLQLARQKAQVKKAQADVDYLLVQKQRIGKLTEKNNSAISEFERVTKDLLIAENDVIDLSIAVEQTLLAIEKTTIIAPFTGNISQRFAHEGELITLGRPLVQLVDTQNLDIKIAAPLTIAPFLKRDAVVMVKWQNELISLPVRTWSQAGEQSSRTFDVRLAANGLNILSGTPVTVSLPKQQAKDALLVPRDALVLRENETYVLTVDKALQAHKVSVLVGQGVDDWVSVMGNLTVNDSVVVRGGERLQNGQKVRFNNALVAKL